MNRDNSKKNFSNRNYVAARANNGLNFGGELKFVLTEEFDQCPSLTIQWLLACDKPEGENYSIQKVILGYHDDEYDRNYLMIAEVQISLNISDPDYSSNTECLNKNDVNDEIIMKIIKEINHDGHVNIARYMPKKDSIIATKTNGPEVYIFDTDKQQPSRDDRARPELRLLGHKSDGYGLSWSNFNSGHLLSGDYDGNICIWDVNATPNNLTLDPSRIFKVNEGDVKDIAWNPKNANLFGSVGKRNLHLWDVRAPIVNNPVQYCNAHFETVNCLSFNPFKEWNVATGSSDETIKLWDTRKIGKSNDKYQYVHSFKQVDGAVLRVDWNPNNETMFASGCHLGRVAVWDIRKVDDKKNDMDIEEGPPLLFVHHDHKGQISDLSWNPYEDMMIASVDDENLIHLWKMYFGNHKEDDDDDWR